METKESILKVALELFSKKGYKSSSVREIASRIGIKESSLYFHYTNKQAILDSLMDKFVSISEETMSFLSCAIENIVSINDEQFCAITEKYLQNYLINDFISKVIMVMNHERSHNEHLRQQYIYWCINKPIEFQMRVFEKFQEIGYLSKMDTSYVALAYYSPIFYYFNHYMNHECTDEDKKSFIEAVLKATQNFIQIYREKI